MCILCISPTLPLALSILGLLLPLALNFPMLFSIPGPYWAVCCADIGREVCLGNRCSYKDSLYGHSGHYAKVDYLVLYPFKTIRQDYSGSYLNVLPLFFQDIARLAFIALRNENINGKLLTFAGPRAWTTQEVLTFSLSFGGRVICCIPVEFLELLLVRKPIIMYIRISLLGSSLLVVEMLSVICWDLVELPFICFSTFPCFTWPHVIRLGYVSKCSSWLKMAMILAKTKGLNSPYPCRSVEDLTWY